MNKLVDECFKDPLKLEIYLRIKFMKQATTKQLLELNPLIPPATLYRRLKKMTDTGVLKIVEEHKVRGVMEKVYAVAVEIDDEVIGSQIDEQRNETPVTQVAAVMSQLFEQYVRPGNELSSHNSKYLFCETVYATAAELKSAAEEIEAILNKLKNNKKNETRNRQSIGVFITPPENDKFR